MNIADSVCWIEKCSLPPSPNPQNPYIRIYATPLPAFNRRSFLLVAVASAKDTTEEVCCPPSSNMADVHSKETRSYNMSRIKGKDTKPEMLVRRFLHANGVSF